MVAYWYNENIKIFNKSIILWVASQVYYLYQVLGYSTQFLELSVEYFSKSESFLVGFFLSGFPKNGGRLPNFVQQITINIFLHIKIRDSLAWNLLVGVIAR